MPIYEYECAACGDRCEVLVRSEADKPRCPECNSARLKKAISAPSVITRGSKTSSVKTWSPPMDGGGSCCGGGGCGCR
jgi:putative FmdB family regulatory protein